MFFDAATTQMRADLLIQAINAGKHVYCEKPVADTLDKAIAAGASSPRPRASRTAWCRTSCSCPACARSRCCATAGFFGRMLSVRGEFGYWVFEGDLGPAGAATS